ncbi:MAG TPA: hypothetical protein VK530_03795 [Candidatus Acidoferrum sp.]|nr:hypothetical protein [Candidatus Acidoferrum sp.]
MKRIIALIITTLFLITLVGTSAESPATNTKWEYAVVKWDGPDRIYYNLPGKFELVYLTKQGVVIPKEAQAEEFCLAHASNKMAKDGWEAVNLDSRRILFRRAAR